MEMPHLLLILSFFFLRLSSEAHMIRGGDEDDSTCFPQSPMLPKFLDELSFPPIINASSYITLGAFKITQRVHPYLPNTTFYAFGTTQHTASVPGPTLSVERNISAYIRWENHIPDEEHFIPIYNGSNQERARPKLGGIPIVIHLHGGENPSIYDGHPEAWFTPKNEKGPSFVTQDYVYLNTQPSTALWYHDHTLGIVRYNLLAGLFGFYFISSAQEEEELGTLFHHELPTITSLYGSHGLPLVLTDLRLFSNGSIHYPGPDMYDDPSKWCGDWFDTWIVNGKAWPYLNVYQKPYRFRILNACNARYAALSLTTSSGISIPFLQIGTDGGFLPQPVELYNILLSPAERMDVIIDFSHLPNGTDVIVKNENVVPEEAHSAGYHPPQILTVMKFIVLQQESSRKTKESPNLIKSLRSFLTKFTATEKNHLVSSISQVPVRKLRFDIYRKLGLMIMNNKTWFQEVTELPAVGSTEIWELINVAGPHNFHLHLIQFQVLNWQSIDADAITNGSCSFQLPYGQHGTCITGPPQKPEIYQRGWKDTVMLWHSTVVRLLLRFTTRQGLPFHFDATKGPGYVYHCHVAQHEDHAMLRPFKLISQDNKTSI